MSTTHPTVHRHRYPMPWAPHIDRPQIDPHQWRQARVLDMLLTLTTGIFVPEQRTTIAVARAGAGRLTAAEVTHIMSGCRAAAGAMAMGRGTRNDWVSLCSALNIARAIDDIGAVLRGLRGHLDDIEATLRALATRAGEDDHPPTWNAPALRFDEMDAVRLLAELFQTQLDQLSYAEYQDAYALAVARVRSGGGEVANPHKIKGAAA